MFLWRQFCSFVLQKKKSVLFKLWLVVASCGGMTDGMTDFGDQATIIGPG
jgi:hypothetical protein